MSAHFRRLVELELTRIGLLDRIERGVEQEAHSARLARQVLALVAGLAGDRPASACASETIDSASRFAWSRSSWAARSAETRVVRRNASISRYRFSSPSSRSTRWRGPPAPPDGLEALGDLLQQTVDGFAVVTEQARAGA